MQNKLGKMMEKDNYTKVVEGLFATATIPDGFNGASANLPPNNDEIMSITYACGLRASVDPVAKEQVKSVGMGR